jgi:hypothetical protein
LATEFSTSEVYLSGNPVYRPQPASAALDAPRGLTPIDLT